MIQKYPVYLTPFSQYRNLHIYLPDDYETSHESYPVVYMFDGHNLFFDEEATYGQSWGLNEFLKSYDKNFIVVGIECNHEGNERLSEYCPYDVHHSFFGSFQGKGKDTLDWLVYELKPYIDKKYRTIPFRECSAIAGSSMGGLMAFYAVTHYNQYFSKAACLSPAFGFCKKDILNELPHSLSLDTRVYLSVGEKEGIKKEDIIPFVDYLNQQKTITSFQIIINGQHNEETWKKQNQIYYDFLWK